MTTEQMEPDANSPVVVETEETLTSAQKAAIIITALPPEDSGNLLNQLGEAHIRAYIRATSQMRTIPIPLLEKVIVEFLESLGDSDLKIGPETAQEVLSRIMSPEAVSNVISDATGVARSVWDQVTDVPHEELAEYVASEHPRAASIILSKLPVETAAAVIALLEADVSERIVGLLEKLSDVESTVLDAIGEAMRVSLLDKKGGDTEEPDALVGAIFDNLSERKREPLMKGLSEKSPEFAKAVARRMFLFEDIPSRISTKAIPALTRTADQALLKTVIAFGRGKNSEVPDFLIGNMSRRLAEQLEEEVAEMSEVSVDEGEEAEAEIVKILKRLEASGEIEIGKPPEDEA